VALIVPIEKKAAVTLRCDPVFESVTKDEDPIEDGPQEPRRFG
jgi:hypothetical protein